MRKYYAYIPTQFGDAPTGTANRMLFELKTDRGAIKRAEFVLGKDCVVVSYSNFYDDKTFRSVKGKYITFDETIPARREFYSKVEIN